LIFDIFNNYVFAKDYETAGYWSRNYLKSDLYNGWALFVGNTGAISSYYGKGNLLSVRCVRGYKAKDDPLRFFRDENGSFVYDSTSRLMWQDDEDAKTSVSTWGGAVNYCENLTLGGYTNWHLPNFNELYEIVDLSRSTPAIDSIFQNVANANYWSSTDIAEGYSDSWVVDFTKGDATTMDWYDNYYVRCVRIK